MIILGQRIKQLRTEKGFSQQKLADVLDVHQTTIKDWETGRHRPSYEMLIKFSQLFSVTIGQLIGTEDY